MPWSISVADQFTHFGTMRLDGSRVADPADQRLDSTVTQLVVSRGFGERFSLQANLPVIFRSFRRPENDVIETGHVRGLGDASLLARFEVLTVERENLSAIASVFGGVKFATGNSDRIGEEMNESDEPVAMPSGVHGHDLTLGTGSTDALVGANAFVRFQRLFATASLQYADRNRGRFDYRFANDLTWEIAPGAYVWLAHQHTLGVQVAIAGERKANDDMAGVRTDDTGITAVYVGPRLTYTYQMRLSAGAGAEFPVTMHNTGLQLTPDYRLRANVTWSF